jgi:hypothetical protein
MTVTFESTPSILVLGRISTDLKSMMGLVRILDFDEKFEDYARMYLTRIVTASMAGSKQELIGRVLLYTCMRNMNIH